MELGRLWAAIVSNNIYKTRAVLHGVQIQDFSGFFDMFLFPEWSNVLISISTERIGFFWSWFQRKHAIYEKEWYMKGKMLFWLSCYSPYYHLLQYFDRRKKVFGREESEKLLTDFLCRIFNHSTEPNQSLKSPLLTTYHMVHLIQMFKFIEYWNCFISFKILFQQIFQMQKYIESLALPNSKFRTPDAHG